METDAYMERAQEEIRQAKAECAGEVHGALGYLAGRVVTLEDKLAAGATEPKLLSELALELCHAIEAQPASAALTECTVLASQLRRALDRYEQTRELTPEENAKIDAAWKRHSAVPLNPNR